MAAGFAGLYGALRRQGVTATGCEFSNSAGTVAAAMRGSARPLKPISPLSPSTALTRGSPPPLRGGGNARWSERFFVLLAISLFAPPLDAFLPRCAATVFTHLDSTGPVDARTVLGVNGASRPLRGRPSAAIDSCARFRPFATKVFDGQIRSDRARFVRRRPWRTIATSMRRCHRRAAGAKRRTGEAG